MIIGGPVHGVGAISATQTYTNTSTATGSEHHGWICPKCQRCYSPYTSECFTCNQSVSVPYAVGIQDGTQMVPVSQQEQPG